MIYLFTLLLAAALAVWTARHPGKGQNAVGLALDLGLYGFGLLIYSYLFAEALGLESLVALPALTESARRFYEYTLWVLTLFPLGAGLGLAGRLLEGKPGPVVTPKLEKTWGAAFAGGLALFLCAFTLKTQGENALQIREVCLRNATTLADEAGVYWDYVELYNPAPFPVDARELYLSDDSREPRRSLEDLPVIPAGGSALVLTGKGPEGFGLRGTGEDVYLMDGRSKILDAVSVPELGYDLSWARNAETGVWELQQPTPGSENAGRPFVRLEAPEFSAEGGFYAHAFDLELTAKDGYRIYYTLDSREPDETSLAYSGPIRVKNICDTPAVYRAVPNVVRNWLDDTPEKENVDKAMIVRAVAVDEAGNRSDVVTQTYFVGMEAYEDRYVLSLVSDPENLFGDNGIYVTGKAYDDWYLSGREGEQPAINFLQHGDAWEVPVQAQLFLKEKKMDQAAGMRIQGSSTRQMPLKRLTVTARNRYSGNRYFDYGMFGVQTHSLFMREDLTDTLIHDMITDLGIGGLGAAEASVFLDGEHWYDTYLRERYTESYVAVKYQVDEQDVTVAKAVPQEIYDFLNSHDMALPESYEALDEIMDIDSYIKYMSVCLYVSHMDADENHNIRLWKSGGYSGLSMDDGRWRFMLYDVGHMKFDVEQYQLDCFTVQQPFGGHYVHTETPIFAALKENPCFRERFILTFQDLANTTFAPERAERYLKKWGTDLDWEKSFFRYRADYILPYMADFFGLQGMQKEITLQVREISGGTVSINTVTPELTGGRWSGKYYTDYPVTITASPLPGYEFVAWHHDGETVFQQTVTLEADGSCWEAEFRKIGA